MSETTTKPLYDALGPVRLAQVASLSLYCAAAVLVPAWVVYSWFDYLFSKSPGSSQNLFGAMLLMGVLGSGLRGMSNLFSDVGKKRYEPAWSLSILMRPLEGLGIALVSYLAITAGIILLEQGTPSPNPAGYLFIGILSGMFSHRAADALRTRFDALWGRQTEDGQ